MEHPANLVSVLVYGYRVAFDYRQPGLFVLVGRTYALPQPHVISEQPYFAGCRSWVELPDELPTAGGQSAISDDQFAAVRERVRRALGA